MLNLCDQIRTSVCITPPRLLAHDVINYGVPICAFYGNVTPRRSKQKLHLSDLTILYVLGRSRAPSSALILIKRDLTNSPDPAHAVQGGPKPSASKN